MIAGVIGHGAGLRRPDAYTKLLLRGDGNGATIRDMTGKTVTATGNATLSTTQRRYVGKAIYLDGAGDYLTIPDSSDWDLTTEPFTIEFDVRFTNVGVTWAYLMMGTQEGTSKWSVFLYGLYDAGARGLYFQGTGIDIHVTAPEMVANTWYHFEISRSGSSWRFFVNGTQIGATQTSGASVASVAADLRIGADGAGTWFVPAYIQNYRISRGIARHTANFTRPTRRI